MNLQRLKELAQRVNYQDFSVNHSGYGVVSSDGTFADCLGMDEATFIYAANPSVVLALIGNLEAVERERDELRAWHDTRQRAVDNLDAERGVLRAEIARRDAAASEPVDNPVLGYADSYRSMASRGVENVPIWSVITDLERNIAPLYTATPPADSAPDGLSAAVNLLLDSDGSRGTFSAIRRGDALAEVERLLAAAPAASVKYALCEAVNAIYFNDSSDYLSALWSIVRFLSPETADLLAKDERAAFERVNANLQHAAAPAPGGDGG